MTVGLTREFLVELHYYSSESSIFMFSPCVTELSDKEADSGKEEEEAAEVAVVETPTQKSRSKKKKAHSKKEPKGEKIHFVHFFFI